MKHVLVTNDFPPKVGGIQTLLWDWWRHLPEGSFAVLTSPYRGAAEFDSAQPFRIERTREPVLLPHPAMIRRVESLVEQTGAELVVLDPALPLGLIGPHLSVPYDVVVQGAEVVIPARLLGARTALKRVLSGARRVISISDYTAAAVDGALGVEFPTTVIPPAVDVDRFVPLDLAQRRAARQRFGLDESQLVVLGLSRLVRRKGFDIAIEAVARLRHRFPELVLVLAGQGRDERRLRRLAEEREAPVRFFGRMADDDLPELYGCADVFTMLCADRWFGMEQEGFGIVYLEAAAAGVPQIAGRSGGAAEAVVDGDTGLVVAEPRSVGDVTDALATLLSNPSLRRRMGVAARRRAADHFSNLVVSRQLAEVLGADDASRHDRPTRSPTGMTTDRHDDRPVPGTAGTGTE